MLDTCNNHNDSIDIDSDGVPDGCDTLIDSDGDGVSDQLDICPNFDDAIDIDADKIPDGCDDAIETQKEKGTEQKSMNSETIRAVGLISVLLVVSVLLVMLIRKGKPPSSEQHLAIPDKNYTEF